MFKDVASNASVYLVAKNHGLWGGVADGLADVLSVLSIGVTAVVTVQHGFSPVTVFSMAALFGGSILGGVLGTRLGKRASDHLDSQKVAVLISK